MNVRFRFSKLGRVRWTSQRDVARMWERALRRARLPVAYTEGFSPRPKLSFGLALPTGCESTAEYIDVSLSSEVSDLDASDMALITKELDQALPDGVDVMAVGVVPLESRSLQEEVTSCSWEIEVRDSSPIEVRTAAGRVLDADSLPLQRERKGRVEVDDLRPSVLALSVAGSSQSGPLILADLATRPRGVRPAELARLMAVELGKARRTSQWIERDGSVGEPLAVDAAPAAVVGGSA